MSTATLERIAAPMREYKSLIGAQTKILTDEGEGVVEIVVSVTGIEDHVGDVIEPGAYEKTLQKRWPKGVSHHDWETPVAKALNIRELRPGDPDLPKTTARGEPWPAEAGAVMVKALYNLDTEDGRKAYSNVKFFEDEAEWSIGYNVPKGCSRMVKGVRYIKELDWYEWSDVLFGAAPHTGTHGIKSMGGMLVGTGAPTMDLGHAEVKALPGSYEDRQNRIREAVEKALIPNREEKDAPYEWVGIRATYDDHVVVCHEKSRDSQDYRITYALVGDEVTLGAPQAVKVVETVVPDDDEDDADATDTTDEHKTADPDEDEKQEPKPEEDKEPDDDSDEVYSENPGDKPGEDEVEQAQIGNDKKPDDDDDDDAESKTAYLTPGELAAMDEIRAELTASE